jgi:hypothetical protein
MRRIFYNMYAFESVYPFTVDRGVFLILSWGKASDQIENVSLPFKSLSFWLFNCFAPSVCIIKPGVPDLEIDQKIMKYAERCKMETMYLY